MLNQKPESSNVLSELTKEELIALLEEKDRIIKRFGQQGLDPSVKELWEAITRLRDRVDNLEQLIARVSANNAASMGQMYANLEDFCRHLFEEEAG